METEEIIIDNYVCLPLMLTLGERILREVQLDLSQGETCLMT